MFSESHSGYCEENKLKGIRLEGERAVVKFLRNGAFGETSPPYRAFRQAPRQDQLRSMARWLAGWSLFARLHYSQRARELPTSGVP